MHSQPSKVTKAMYYYLFISSFYYPAGGAIDFIKKAESIEDLKFVAEKFVWENKEISKPIGHIADANMKIKLWFVKVSESRLSIDWMGKDTT